LSKSFLMILIITLPRMVLRKRADSYASIVEAPKQRSSREENKQIKNGDIPENWTEKKLRRKDIETDWVKKNGTSYYGYKNHEEVDVKHKFIRKYKVTPSPVHDSNVFEEILDDMNINKDVFADSAYRSKETLEELEDMGYREHLQRKGCKHKKLTDREIQGNHTRSKIRSRIEHVFAAFDSKIIFENTIFEYKP
jgi:IS5 family transposase